MQQFLTPLEYKIDYIVMLQNLVLSEESDDAHLKSM